MLASGTKCVLSAVTYKIINAPRDLLKLSK